MLNTELQKALVSINGSIEEAVISLNSSRKKVVLITNDKLELQGVLSDSDLRYLMLEKIPLSDPISQHMVKDPVVAYTDMDSTQILDLMKETARFQIPILDNLNRVVNLVTINEILSPPKIENPVVIMAGGLGRRLQAHTNGKPKPLVSIGGKPVLRIIIDKLLHKGLSNIHLSLNYKADMILDELNRFDKYKHIQYVLENKRMGTAGALSLLPQQNDPTLVINADIITTIDYNDIIKFHNREQADITVAVRREKISIPYGVMELAGNQVKGIAEKPEHYYFANIGIYILSPQVIAEIPSDEFTDMTTVIERAIDKKLNVKSFAIHEYWIDIGRPSELEKARLDYPEIEEYEKDSTNIGPR